MAHSRSIGIVLFIFGLICGVASVAIDYWYHLNLSDESAMHREIYFGLWEFCHKVDGAGTSYCESWSDFEHRTGGALDMGWLNGCQAMMITGVCLNAVALLGTVLASIKHTTALVAQIGASIAGICYIIAVVIFGVKYEDGLSIYHSGGDLHVGFWLAVVAGIFNLISICLIGQGSAEAGYDTM